MRLWKPLLSLERGTQLPPHHAGKPLCLDLQLSGTLPPNTQDAGSLTPPPTHTHSEKGWEGTG